MASRRPNVVVIGGGTGCPTVLRALTSSPANLTAIVTTFDNGGSTGRLRAQLGLPALGDLRRVLGALATQDEPYASLAKLLEHRFQGQGALGGHALGNLLLAGLCQAKDGLEGALDEASRLLGVQGEVIPVSLDDTHLGARLADGTRLLGEEIIDHLPPGSLPIVEVFLEPQAQANPRAVDALVRANVIVLGPGDLYTSLLPNLLVTGISEALRASHARTIMVCNLANRPGQTDGFTLASYLKEVLRYLGAASLDAALVNSATLPHGHEAVPNDAAECGNFVGRVVTAPMASPDGRRHDEGALGRELWQLIAGLSTSR
ncbi:MAG: YvcK family protein [Dehalococcoidia bacterium]|nr:YvcK family protein [Dehalococcoidia bacterium]